MGPSHHVHIPPTKENEEESLYTTSLLASLWPELSPSTTLRYKAASFSWVVFCSVENWQMGRQNTGTDWQFVPRQPRLRGSELAQQCPHCVSLLQMGTSRAVGGGEETGVHEWGAPQGKADVQEGQGRSGEVRRGVNADTERGARGSPNSQSGLSVSMETTDFLMAREEDECEGGFFPARAAHTSH